MIGAAVHDPHLGRRVCVAAVETLMIFVRAARCE
jgi:hypothetical protein